MRKKRSLRGRSFVSCISTLPMQFRREEIHIWRVSRSVISVQSETTVIRCVYVGFDGSEIDTIGSDSPRSVVQSLYSDVPL